MSPSILSASSSSTQTFDASLIPLPLFLSSFTFVPLVFLLFTKILFPIHFALHQTKRRAWILSGVTAIIMTTLGLPFVYDFVRVGGDVGEMNKRRREEHGNRELLGQVLCCGYLAFLVCDLVLGRIFYKEHMTYLRATGYVHHPVYAVMMVVCLATHQEYIFGIATLMEFPSFFSSLSNMNPRFRNDVLFSALFFATRVVFHSCMSWGFVREWVKGGDVTTMGVFFPLMALPLHMHWARASIKGILRRRKLRSSTVVETLQDAASSTALLFDPSVPLSASRLQF
ncbi:hypothetical protein BDY24DRAFT_405077 [Mrakia frigida]|uniref:uncharacterized protein n=1 Tax=Mrakia frigida TaxID=29902 RepID=UPI003FCC2624